MEGNVYRITNSQDGCFYIGSTICDLKKRLREHRADAKRHTNKVYKHIDWDNATIELIEKCTIENRQQLREVEQRYIVKSITNPLCLNTFRAIRTEQPKYYCAEYYKNNKEVARAYYQRNRDRILKAKSKQNS